MVKVKKIINTLSQSLCLESGLILGPHGSEGSVRENVEITEDEQRRLGGHHVIIEYGGPSLLEVNDGRAGIKSESMEAPSDWLAEWGIAYSYRLSGDHLSENFTKRFGELFKEQLTDNLERAVARYVNERHITEEEAREQALAVRDEVVAHYMHHACQFYKENINWMIRQAAHATLMQAQAFAKCVLDGVELEDDPDFISRKIVDADKTKHIDEALNSHFAAIRTHLNEAIKKERLRQEGLLAERSLVLMTDLCLTIRKYYLSSKDEFYSQFKFRDKKPTHEEWKREWLRRAKEQFHEVEFAAVRGPAGPRPFPEDFFEGFVPQRGETASPKSIAKKFVARLFGVSPSHFEKRVLPKGTKKRRKNVRSNVPPRRTKNQEKI